MKIRVRSSIQATCLQCLIEHRKPERCREISSPVVSGLLGYEAFLSGTCLKVQYEFRK